MTEDSKSPMGERLYASLPSVYRERDGGDLRKFLDGCGRLLDRVRPTIEQRLADSFADNPEENRQAGGAACQSWVLPYFADLLDARLVSPAVAGRRDEISKAVVWRQSKGTRPCVESITESVGQTEAEIQEGWQKVAVTPRMDPSVIPARAYGYEKEVSTTIGRMAARHPGLPTATVDVSCCSGAVLAKENSPGSRSTDFDGVRRSWRQAAPFGVPAHPGSYDDVSRRTVDLRTPSWKNGHYHPKRLLLFVPPPAGFYSSDTVNCAWSGRNIAGSPFQTHIEEIPPDVDGGIFVHRFRNRSLATDRFQPVRITGRVEPEGEVPFSFSGLTFRNSLVLHHAPVYLNDCALFRVESHLPGTDAPVISAKSCLIRSLRAAGGRVDLEYCTVLLPGIAEALNASDSILVGPVVKDDTPASGGPEKGCFRFSRYHPDQDVSPISLYRSSAASLSMFSTDFGSRSCGVLHPACPEKVRFGAEDGGEMGAYHQRHYSLLFSSVEEKLKDFLPVGIETALIPDLHLLDQPK